MPKFLNTSATTYYLEELIKNSRERLWLISPYLKLNERIKELLEDKDRLKIDVRLVYGKSELQPAEVNWLKKLHYIRTSYCHNLHAKCYISESACIITSLNLYEFSQVNNNEMGVYIERDDGTLYQDAYAEAQRIIRISDEVKISLDVVEKNEKAEAEAEESGDEKSDKKYSGLTTAQLAEKHSISTHACNQKLCDLGLQEQKDKNLYYLTDKGKEAGGVLRKGKFGWFIVWPEDLTL